MVTINKMKKNVFNLVLMVFVLLNVECTLASDDQYSGPDFSAMKVMVDEDGKTLSKIHMSHAGYREVLMSNAPFEIMFISNYSKKKTWMVIPSKKIYTDMDAFSQDGDDDFIESTMFDDKPCKGFDKTKMLSTKNLHTQKIEEWGCIDKKSKKSILQWFDPKIKMVIREIDKVTLQSDILVSDLKFQKQSDSLFTLPGDYKKVSMDAMMKMMQTQ